MHVVIVDEELPYPATSGKRLRILGLVQHLAKRHRITFLCHRNADAEEAQDASRHLASCGIETLLVDRTLKAGPQAGARRDSRRLRAVGQLRFGARLALNLLSPMPYSAQWNKCARLREAVESYRHEHTVDIWQCEWAPYATAFLESTDIRWAMMAHDIQSFAWERYYRNETSLLKRWYVKKQWAKYRRYEAQVFSEAAMTITVSEEDQRRVREHFTPRLTAVVDNGVDLAYYQSRTRGALEADEYLQSPGSYPPRTPTDILFLGNLEFRPNLDAVRLLLDEVFPRVLAAIPRARLCIVGRRPPEWLRRRGRDSANVEVHADVGDVRPFLFRCGAMAVPLRIAGGSRLKILEALACGLPVVASTVGAEGLHLLPGVHFARADQTTDMAQVLIDWMRNPASARAMVQAGRAVVESRYDWSVLAQKMERAWEEMDAHTRRTACAVKAGGIHSRIGTGEEATIAS
jgi:glycosyltransferase involved in cell wall biosynthesis